jgi:hypothetical protein
MQHILLDAAERNDCPLIDMNRIITDKTEDGLPGDEWLLDHVHLRIEGHQLLADEIMGAMIADQLIQPAADWRTRRRQLWQAHFDTLDDLYFARGQARLESLLMWSRGTRDPIDD